jgi:hypothetical protein
VVLSYFCWLAGGKIVFPSLILLCRLWRGRPWRPALRRRVRGTPVMAESLAWLWREEQVGPSLHHPRAFFSPFLLLHQHCLPVGSLCGVAWWTGSSLSLYLSSMGGARGSTRGIASPLSLSMRRSMGGLDLAPPPSPPPPPPPPPLNSSATKDPPLCRHALEGTHLPFSPSFSLLKLDMYSTWSFHHLSVLCLDLALEVFVHLFLSRFATLMSSLFEGRH